MTEWLSEPPWGKIAAVAASSLAIAAGSLYTKDSVDNKLEDARAPITVQQAHMLEHFDWQSSCEIVAANEEAGVEDRVCPSDQCGMTIWTRSGLRMVFFALAPKEVPRAPLIVGEAPAFDLFGGVAYAAAPYTCISPESHGPPDGDPPMYFGEDLGGGWVEQFVSWRDSCLMGRRFHRPSQSATDWQWSRCAERH